MCPSATAFVYAARAMALTSTVYIFALQIADMDRGVYADLELRVARHPSETAEYLLARVLAYSLEYQDGITLTEGIAAGDEPAVLVRDLTGQITAWIEVGNPDAERLHRGIKKAGRASVYTHRDPRPYLEQLAGKKIHKAAEIPVYALDRELIAAAVTKLEKRNSLSVSVTERQLYLEMNGHALSGSITTHALT